MQLHNCQIRDIYIIQLFKESFWPSFCNEKCGLHARRTSADFRRKYAKENSLTAQYFTGSARVCVAYDK